MLSGRCLGINQPLPAFRITYLSAAEFQIGAHGGRATTFRLYARRGALGHRRPAGTLSRCRCTSTAWVRRDLRLGTAGPATEFRTAERSERNSKRRKSFTRSLRHLSTIRSQQAAMRGTTQFHGIARVSDFVPSNGTRANPNVWIPRRCETGSRRKRPAERTLQNG